MASNILKKITSEAKRMRKSKPGMSWRNAVKAAGKKYRGSKTKKATTRKKPAKVSGIIKKPRVQVATAANVGSVAMHKSAIKSHYKIDLGNVLMRRELATTKSEKKKLTKKAHTIKRALLHFS